MSLHPLEAAAELKKRQNIPGLRRRVEEYLQGDIPEYFKNGPVLYLGRHIATPNFETLRFIHIVEPLGMKTVVSEDTGDLFVSQNHAKRALCKLPICHRITQKKNRYHEKVEYFTVVDFKEAEGKRFFDIETVWGERLVDFHTRLFAELVDGHAERHDDSSWIDRNHRGNLLEHFKKLLALFIVHGIFFEDYVPRDANFVQNVFRPAMRFVEEKFGYRPLISQLVPESPESELFWICYPNKVADLIKASMKSTGERVRQKEEAAKRYTVLHDV